MTTTETATAPDTGAATTGPTPRTEWMAMHSAIWGRHGWPTGTVLVIPRTPVVGRGVRSTEVPIDDASAAWDVIERLDAAGNVNVYVNVAGHHTGATANGSRGLKTTIAGGVPALYVDLDIDTPLGGHRPPASGRPHPSPAQAREMLARCPLGQPTVAYDTGGGWHAYWVLDALLEPSDPLLLEWRDWWVSVSEAMFAHVDVGVCRDAVRMLRPAGSHRRKLTDDGVVTDHLVVALDGLAGGDVVAVDDARELLAVSTTDTGASSVTPATTRRATYDPTTDTADENWPSVRISREVDPGDMLLALGWQEASGGGWVDPGSVADDHSVSPYQADDESPPMVTVWGSNAAAWLGVDEGVSLTTWGLLRACCGGDTELAKRVADRFEAEWEDLLAGIEKVTEVETIDSVPAWLRETCPVTVTEPTTDTDDGAPDDATIWDYLDGETVTVTYDIGEGYFARVGAASQVGIFSLAPVLDDAGDAVIVDGRPKMYEAYCTDWLWVVTAERQYVGSDDVPSGDPEYDVALIRAGQPTYHRPGLPKADAFRADRVVEEFGGGVVTPSARKVLTALRSAASTIGYETRPQDVRYLTMGWHTDSRTKERIYVGGRSTITADGVHESDSVAASRTGGATMARLAAATGWTEPLREGDTDRVVEAVNAMMAVSPEQPVIGATVLGAAMSAALDLDSRPTTIIQGRASSGKTALCRLPLAFLADADVALAKRTSTFYLPNLGGGTTWKGALSKVASYGHMPALIDDLKATVGIGVDGGALRAAHSFVASYSQGAYGADDDAKGTVDGGYTAVASHASTGLISAEVWPTDEAIATRCIMLSLDSMPLDLTRGTSPVDKWREIAQEGVMQRWWVSLVQHLLGDGRQDYYRAEVARHTQEMGGERPAEHTAVVWTGWHLLRDLVGDHPDFPTEEKVTQWMASLFSVTVAAHADRALNASIIGVVLSALDAGTAYLRSARGPDAPGDPLGPKAAGWREERDYQDHPGWEHSRSATELGEYHAATDEIRIYRRALTEVLRHAGLVGLPTEQIVESVRAAGGVANETGEKVRWAASDTGWARGYRFSRTDLFGPDDDDETDAGEGDDDSPQMHDPEPNVDPYEGREEWADVIALHAVQDPDYDPAVDFA